MKVLVLQVTPDSMNNSEADITIDFEKNNFVCESKWFNLKKEDGDLLNEI